MEQKQLRHYTPVIIIFYILAAAALITAAFKDLQIDIALNNTGNFVANWFAGTGEMPAYLLGITACAFLVKCLQKKGWKAVFCLALLGIGGYFGSYVSRRLFAETEFRLGYGLLFGIGTALVVLFALHFIEIPKKYRNPLIAMALIGICVCAVETGAISLMKMLWGRVRFRDLDGAYSQFTAWFVLNGNTGDHSFPSGHTGSAGMSYMMMLLPEISKKCRKHRLLCFAVPFFYTTTVAVTRLVMGAHYLSDVTVGGTIAFTCVLIGMRVYEALAKRDFKLQKK